MTSRLEASIAEGRPNQLLQEGLSEAQKLFNGAQRGHLLWSIREKLGDFSKDEVKEFTGLLVTGLVSPNPFWTDQRRSGALQLLPIIVETADLRPEPVELRRIYEKAIRRQAENPPNLLYVTVPMIVAAGEIFREHFPKNRYTYHEVRSAWQDLARGIAEKEGGVGAYNGLIGQIKDSLQGIGAELRLLVTRITAPDPTRLKRKI